MTEHAFFFSTQSQYSGITDTKQSVSRSSDNYTVLIITTNKGFSMALFEINIRRPLESFALFSSKNYSYLIW